MNFPMSRFPESAQPSNQNSPKGETKPHTHKPSSDSSDSTVSSSTQSYGPIPAPSHPRQYRAIGLIKGKYQHQPEKMTCGELTTPDGIKIEAVLLGRMISLIKNHIDLNNNHLWVVYPRVNQKTEQLHVQLVGIWEPETLAQDSSPLPSERGLSSPIEAGFFSIRGEVVYASEEKRSVIVKICQSPRKEGDKPKFFKLKLQGILPPKPVGHFWDLEVKLEETRLMIQQGKDLGIVNPIKVSKTRNKARNSFKRDNKFSRHFQERSSNPEKPTLRPKSSPAKPTLPKPFKGKPPQKDKE